MTRAEWGRLVPFDSEPIPVGQVSGGALVGQDGARVVLFGCPAAAPRGLPSGWAIPVATTSDVGP
jgi:hypothetical protein